MSRQERKCRQHDQSETAINSYSHRLHLHGSPLLCKSSGSSVQGMPASLCTEECTVRRTCCLRNTINGRVYKDDPTIFAWDLMNEPRCDCFPDSIPPPPHLVSCRPECATKMQVWPRLQIRD